MRKLIVSVVVMLALPTLSLAMDQETKERIEALEKRQAELSTNLQEETSKGGDSGWMDRFTFSGAIDVRASYASIDGEDDETDIVLDTAELGIAAQVNADVVAEILFLAEEEDDGGIDFSVDEAFLAYKEEVAKAGLFYIPFGAYNSYMITDPLTLDLGESQEVALMGGWSNDVLSVAAFIYNGDADEVGDDNVINDFGASIVVTPMDGVEVGVSFIRDLGDSDTLSDELGGEFTDEVSGLSAYGLLTYGQFALTGEIVAALDEFSAADDLLGDGSAAQPLAYNIEFAYMPNDQWTGAVRYGGSDEAPLNETQYGIAVSYGVMENIVIAAEYLHGENNDDTEEDIVTLQLVGEF